MPGPLRGAGGSAPPKGRRPKCGAGGGLLCPPDASAPYGGPEASAPPSRRGGPGGRGVDGVRRVSPLEVFLPLGCIDRVCESLRWRWYTLKGKYSLAFLARGGLHHTMGGREHTYT